jgi:D-alanine-D-alanine ligase
VMKKNKKKVGLFFGGISNEAEISVISARNIIKNFDYKKYDLVLVYWRKDKHFYQLNNIDDVKKVSKKTRIDAGNFLKIFDIAFLITHGKYGEDGALQGLLEIQEVPYCGCQILSSSLCMDKCVFKTFLAGHKINQVKFDFIDIRGKKKSDLKKWTEKIEKEFKLPVYIKPSNSGSSVGISKVSDFKNLEAAIKEASKHDAKILVEQGLSNAREIEVAVLGNEDLVISEPGELGLTQDFYDYDEKYKNNRTQVTIPAKIDDKTKQEIEILADKAYRLCDCKGFARIDFFLKGKKVYLNEINTLPGFTDISMFPMLMKNMKIPYKDLINRIIGLAENQSTAP